MNTQLDSFRVAFVGQQIYFEQCVLQEPVAGIEPNFFDFRHDADSRVLANQLKAFAPEIIFVFRPEIIPEGFFRDQAFQKTYTVGYLTEPLPRSQNAHSDLHQRLAYLQASDPTNFDRIAVFDPSCKTSAERVFPHVWRSFPIPVADKLFGIASHLDDLRPGKKPNLVFIGRSSSHREQFLGPLKHDFSLLHIAHGAEGPRFIQELQQAHIAINVHNEPYPTFENRVFLHLAAGQLVISEPLDPSHSLFASVDYLQATTPWSMWRLTQAVIRRPTAFYEVQDSGKRKAENVRASKLYPRILRDLLRDIEHFGSVRKNL